MLERPKWNDILNYYVPALTFYSQITFLRIGQSYFREKAQPQKEAPIHFPLWLSIPNLL
jgi:hypothetical protein